ncbi:MAG: SGNH/GDSL hydrolase family protein [Vicinamibacterales bacterium]
MTRRRFIAFALAAMALSAVVTVAGLLAVDLYLHHRAERSAGLNRWGYRGPVVGAKAPGELRVVMLGGSTVFGYGVMWDQAIPAQLERALAQRRPGLASARVVNLGFNNEGAYAFQPTLEDFAYLDYDVVCLYEGYNDMPGDEGPNTAVFRHRSAVFRLTGYFPLLPLVLDEKAMSLRYGGDLAAAYAAARGERPGPNVFRPNLAQRTSANALDAAKALSESLGRQLDRVSKAPPSALVKTSAIGCAFPWVNYCDSVHRAVDYALAHGQRVVVVSQPRLGGTLTEAHAKQQAMLGAMVARVYGGDHRVVWADLSGVVDVNNPGASFDGMHLNPQSNAVVAEALVAPVLAALGSAESSR